VSLRLSTKSFWGFAIILWPVEIIMMVVMMMMVMMMRIMMMM
jgi:hypothetical protein